MTASTAATTAAVSAATIAAVHAATTAAAAEPEPARGAIVVGASSGIGAALVRELVGRGYRVAALARRTDRLEALAAEFEPDRVLPRTHDVADTDAVPALFGELAEALGRVDLVVYCAGVMPEVGRDEYDTEKDLLQVTVNLAGCLAWGNETARLFRTQRAGTLVGISSVAGDRGRKVNPAYHATKAGMSTYLESLRNRLSEVGVHVLTVKPGMVRTDMTAGIEKLVWPIEPERLARVVVRAAERRFWNTLYVPLRWGLVMAVIRAIPSRLFRHLNF